MKEDLHIKKELEEISPLLSSLREKEKSKMPSQEYFDKMQDEVFATLKLDDKNIQPNDVPAEYFENLPDAVFARLEENKAEVKSINSGYKNWAIAASLVLIVAATYFFLLPKQDNNFANVNDIKAESKIESLAHQLSEEEMKYIIDKYGSDVDYKNLEELDIDVNELELDSKELEGLELLNDEELEYLNEIM